LLNNTEVRDTVLSSAAHRYGFRINQIELRLYVGKFAAPTTRIHEDPIRDWCTAQNVGVGPIRVVSLSEVATTARRVAVSKTYRGNAALTAIKVLDAAGMLQPMDAVPRTDTAQHPAANERTRDEDANTTRATKGAHSRHPRWRSNTNHRLRDTFGQTMFSVIRQPAPTLLAGHTRHMRAALAVAPRWAQSVAIGVHLSD